MRKVFLDNLPKYENGAYIGKINWSKCIGLSVDFINEDVSGVIKIIDYDKLKQKILIEYNDEKTWIFTNVFLKSGIVRLTRRSPQRKSFKCNVGDVVNDMRIIHRFYEQGKKSRIKKYKYQCLKCGYIGDKTENDMLNKKCPICANNGFVDKDINSIKITHPQIYKMITDNDADSYSYGSAHKVHWECQFCKKINFTAIKNLTSNKPTGCQFCGDGVSYPEKILYNVFSFISNTFEKHKSFEWSEGRVYDAFDMDIFTEIHGSQHYIKSFEKCGGRTLEEEIENDKYKHKLAISNHENLVDYVVIKAYPETFDNIKQAILNSRLTQYYDLSKVNWNYVRKQAESSLVVEVGELYNFNDNIDDISKHFQLDKSTVYRYLHKATELGICNFIPDYKNEHCSHKVRCKNTGEIFKSEKEAARWCGLKSSSGINKCVRGFEKYRTAGTHPVTGERLEWELAS